jgi:hypothetical protein
MGFPEIGSAEIGFPEIGFPEIGSAEIGFNEIGSAEIGSAEIGSAEIGFNEIGSAEIGSAEIGSAEMDSDEIGSAEIPSVFLNFPRNGGQLNKPRPSLLFRHNPLSYQMLPLVTNTLMSVCETLVYSLHSSAIQGCSCEAILIFSFAFLSFSAASFSEILGEKMGMSPLKLDSSEG